MKALEYMVALGVCSFGLFLSAWRTAPRAPAAQADAHRLEEAVSRCTELRNPYGTWSPRDRAQCELDIGHRGVHSHKRVCLYCWESFWVAIHLPTIGCSDGCRKRLKEWNDWVDETRELSAAFYRSSRPLPTKGANRLEAWAI